MQVNKDIKKKSYRLKRKVKLHSSFGITPTTSKSETFLKKIKNQGHQQFNHEKKDSYAEDAQNIL